MLLSKGWMEVGLRSGERHGVDLVNHADNFTASESNAGCEAALQTISGSMRRQYYQTVDTPKDPTGAR